MDAVDIGFVGGDTTQRFLIGRASNAVPGTVAGLAAAHASYGTLPWRELLAPAIELARRGIELTGAQALLHDLLDSILRHEGEGRRVYSRPDGGRLVEGDRLVLGDLAATLELIGERGRDAVYRGEIATEIVRHVQEGGGAITHDDLAAYRVVRRRPVSVPFRGDLFTSNPPPSSGGILIAYGLRLLEAMGPPDRAPCGRDRHPRRGDAGADTAADERVRRWPPPRRAARRGCWATMRSTAGCAVSAPGLPAPPSSPLRRARRTSP